MDSVVYRAVLNVEYIEMKKCLGIEISRSCVKIAYMERGVLKNYISERVEADMLPDMRLYAEFLQETLKTHGIRCKHVVFVLRQDDVYVGRFQLPLMTVEQLKLNLPYEFQDYVGDEMEEYQFDYGVLERTDKELDILAAACRKSLCQHFEKLAKMAGLRLTGLVPAVIGMQRILEQVSGDEKKDYAVAELGEENICIQFFRRCVYDTTHTMKVEYRDMEQPQQGNLIAVQIMRVLNFYSFNHADNTIDTLYYCGEIWHQTFIDQIRSTLEIPVKSIGELLLSSDERENPEWIDSPQTVGVLLTLGETL